MPEKNITFEIKEHLGVITKFDSGWNRELNIISWNGGVAKYDLRDWDPYHERMSKGLTLFDGEMRKVVDLYLTNNSQKAVEQGQALEEKRRARQREQFRKPEDGRSGDIQTIDRKPEALSDSHLREVEAQAYEGAVLPGGEKTVSEKEEADTSERDAEPAMPECEPAETPF